MKKFFFLLLVLLGLSQNIFSQESKLVTRHAFNELVAEHGEPLETIRITYGEQHPGYEIDWGEIRLNSGIRNGCSFDVLVHKFCTMTALEVVNCLDCSGYFWNTTPNTNTNVLLVTTPGIYSVTVTSVNNNCTSTAAITVNEIGMPIPVTIDGNSSFCEGGNTILTANAAGVLAYCWNDPGQSKSPAISVTMPGTYSVTVTEITNGCTGTASKTVTVSPPLPKPNILMTYDPSGAIILNGPGGYAQYEWSNGMNRQVIEISEPGFYSISLIVKNQAGCASAPSDKKEFLITDCPEQPQVGGGLSFNASIEWSEVTFTVNIPNPNKYTTYYWDFGDGNFAGGSNTTHQYSAPGNFLVKLRGYYVSGNGTIMFDEVSQTVKIAVFGKPCNRTGLTIKGQGDGAIFTQSQINSQTKVNVAFQLPSNSYNWVWSTGNAGSDAKRGTVVHTSGSTVGTHEMFFYYMVGSENFCHVIKYTVLPGSGIISDTDEIENRSSGGMDFNFGPNPTNGTVQVDLSGEPNGVYMINVINQNGQQVTKKVVKQE